MLCQEAAEGAVLGSVPFHVFMHDLKVAVKCLPVKFTEGPKLGRPLGLHAEGLGWAGGTGQQEPHDPGTRLASHSPHWRGAHAQGWAQATSSERLGAGWEWRRGSQGPSPSQVGDLSVLLCCNG